LLEGFVAADICGAARSKADAWRRTSHFFGLIERIECSREP
jgi:hypothetical protein